MSPGGPNSWNCNGHQCMSHSKVSGEISDLNFQSSCGSWMACFVDIFHVLLCDQVFDILLNGKHAVVDSLDIFSKVGRGAAHDEVIPFLVKNGKLIVGTETSALDNRLAVEFIKVCFQ